MNPSYQQIPVGIPVSQNPYPYPSHPYSNNFPDEPDTDSAQVPPPNNNNQQQYQNQYHFYGQPQAPMGQPMQFYAPGQAPNNNQQPQQYIMVGNPMIVPVDPERRKLQTKIRNLEGKLEKGWYAAYKVWMFINIFFGALYGAQCSIALIIVVFMFDNEAAWSVLGTNVIVLSWCVWLLQHCLVLKNAIVSKNFEAGKRGLNSMMWFAPYYFLTFLSFILIIESIKNDTLMTHYENWIPYEVLAFIIGYAIPQFLNIFGARKVVALLSEREDLVKELEAQQQQSNGANNASDAANSAYNMA